jgi:hypothetical protein
MRGMKCGRGGARVLLATGCRQGFDANCVALFGQHSTRKARGMLRDDRESCGRVPVQETQSRAVEKLALSPQIRIVWRERL